MSRMSRERARHQSDGLVRARGDLRPTRGRTLILGRHTIAAWVRPGFS